MTLTETFTYWWDQAGFEPESVNFEAARNILAFSQFVNTLFLLVRAKNEGIVAVSNIRSFLFAGDTAIPRIDFFQEYAIAADDNRKLDVTGEAYRLLASNFFTLSNMDLDPQDTNTGKKMTDDDFSTMPFTSTF